MKLHEALSELLIFAREHGAEDAELHPAAHHALRRVEESFLALANREAKRRQCRLRDRCVSCSRRSDGLLCWACLADAPKRVRMAFERAVGVDGMRRAFTIVMAWARPNEAAQNNSTRRAA